MIKPQPLSVKGRILAVLLILGLIGIWIIGIYAYLTLPNIIPTHFGISGKPDSYEKRGYF